MKRILGGILVLLLHLSAATVQGETEDESATPAEQYKMLLTHHIIAASGALLPDVDRLKFVGQAFKTRYQIAVELVELAEKYPRDPVAVGALSLAVWQVNTRPWPVELVGKDEAMSRAFAILQRDHLQSTKLGSVCRRLSFGYCKEYETFLHAVLDKSPHKRVRAEACLALAYFLNNRMQKLNLIEERQELVRKFEDLYGKAYIDRLRKQDRTETVKEIEALYEQAVEKYGDVRIFGVGKVGEKAKAILFEMLHLAVGKTAPDIVGMDQEGKPMKLSDYRGKVVLLDFWSEY